MKVIWDNSMLQLNCKFSESEQSSCWVVMLRSVSGININEFKNLCEYGPYAILSEIMHCCSHPASWKGLITDWVIMLTKSTDANYVLNEHDNSGQYHPYAVPSRIISCYHFSANLEDEHSISVKSYELIWHRSRPLKTWRLRSIWPICNTSDIMTCYSYPASLGNLFDKLIELWLGLFQYGICTDIMPCYSYVASLENQPKIFTELSC